MEKLARSHAPWSKPPLRRFPELQAFANKRPVRFLPLTIRTMRTFRTRCIYVRQFNVQGAGLAAEKLVSGGFCDNSVKMLRSKSEPIVYAWRLRAEGEGY